MEQQNTEPQAQNNSKIMLIIIGVLVILLITITIFSFWQRTNIRLQAEKEQAELIRLREELEEVKEISDRELLDTKEGFVDWSNHIDEKAGFSLSFPSDIQLYRDRDSISLIISVAEMEKLDAPLGFTKEIARANEKELRRGEYGQSVDWPLEASKEVKDLGNINAQQFMSLRVIEVCDTRFERTLLFYNNDYQIKITLYGPNDIIISENPKYFKIDEMICGDIQIWDDGKMGKFYSDLNNGLLSGAAQEWFDLFDDIVDTVKIK